MSYCALPLCFSGYYAALLACQHSKYNGWEEACKCISQCNCNCDCQTEKREWLSNSADNVIRDVRNTCNNCLCFSLLYSRARKLVVVFFPGTSQINDYGYDFDFRPTQETINGVTLCLHCGFWRRYNKIKDLLAQELDNLFYFQGICRNEITLALVGHSLGGTTAVLTAAIHPWIANFSKVQVFVFGCPPSCCESINLLLAQRPNVCEIQNYANRFDVVTIPWVYPKWLYNVGNYIVVPTCGSNLFNSHDACVYLKNIALFLAEKE